MLTPNRIQKIINILTEYKKADVSQLSSLLSVSEVTIRKDLEKLEAEGFLSRVHGGAVLNEQYNNSGHVPEPETPELEHKQMIGLIAAHMVHNNEAIYIGPGTTCFQIAKNLKTKKNLTIITNNISAGIELSGLPSIRLIVTGGELKLRDVTHFLTGSAVVAAIKGVYVDKAFLGIDGISFETGYTMYDDDERVIHTEIKNRAKETVIVADSTKYNKTAFLNLGKLDFADKVISDEQVPKDYLKYYFENQIPIFTTYKFD